MGARIHSYKSGARVRRPTRIAENIALLSPYGIVFSAGSLILNLTDGARVFNVVLDAQDTLALAARFAERAAKESV